MHEEDMLRWPTLLFFIIILLLADPGQFILSTALGCVNGGEIVHALLHCHGLR